MTITSDLREDLLATAEDVAPSVICAVRDFDADTIAELIGDMNTDQLRALVVFLAALFDPDHQSLRTALQWLPDAQAAAEPVPGRIAPKTDRVRRHGDHAGWAAHKSRAEKPCQPCLDGHREWDRLRKAVARTNVVTSYTANKGWELIAGYPADQIIDAVDQAEALDDRPIGATA